MTKQLLEPPKPKNMTALFQRILATAFVAGFGKQIGHMMDSDLPLAFDGYNPILG